MSGPDVILLRSDGGTLATTTVQPGDEWHGKEQYIRADIAQRLAEALHTARKDVASLLEMAQILSGPGSAGNDLQAEHAAEAEELRDKLDTIDAALAEYDALMGEENG